jgi:hypothetical protein
MKYNRFSVIGFTLLCFTALTFFGWVYGMVEKFSDFILYVFVILGLLIFPLFSFVFGIIAKKQISISKEKGKLLSEASIIVPIAGFVIITLLFLVGFLVGGEGTKQGGQSIYSEKLK